MPGKHNAGGCGCCGPCVCPECGFTDHNDGVIDPVTGISSKARCRLYWGCCDCEDCEVRLTGESYDYGVVGPSGEIATNVGETYTLISTGPDCTTQTITYTADNDCPCLNGCMTGQVQGAKTSAVLTVSNFGNGLQTSSPGGLHREDQADFSALNHTLTCDVLTLRYLNEDDETCAVDYIAPVADYFIAQVQVFARIYNSPGGTLRGTSWVKWDVYGVMASASAIGAIIVSNGRYLQLKMVYNSRSIYTDAFLGAITPVGGSIGTIFSNHTYTPDGTLALDTTFLPPSAGGGSRGHFFWCDEKMSIGRFDNIGNTVPNPWVPAEWFGLFQWDSIS